MKVWYLFLGEGEDSVCKYRTKDPEERDRLIALGYEAVETEEDLVKETNIKKSMASRNKKAKKEIQKRMKEVRKDKRSKSKKKAKKA